MFIVSVMVWFGFVSSVHGQQAWTSETQSFSRSSSGPTQVRRSSPYETGFRYSEQAPQEPKRSYSYDSPKRHIRRESGGSVSTAKVFNPYTGEAWVVSRPSRNSSGSDTKVRYWGHAPQTEFTTDPKFRVQSGTAVLSKEAAVGIIGAPFRAVGGLFGKKK